MSDYTMSTTVDLSYDDAVTATREALADAGFGVLTEIDLRATLKDKLDVEVPSQVILGACRPQLAHEAIAAEPSVTALLPCNVVVRELDDGRCQVETIDPREMLRLGGAGLQEVATDAHTRLTSVLSALASTERAR